MLTHAQEVFTSQHKKARHWVSQLCVQKNFCHLCSAPRTEAPKTTPVTCPTSWHVAGAHDQVRTFLDLPKHCRQKAGIVLEVCVNAGHVVSPRLGKAIDYGSAQGAIAGTPQAAYAKILLSDLLYTCPSQIRRIIIAHDDFVVDAYQSLAHSENHRTYVLYLIIGGYDDT